RVVYREFFPRGLTAFDRFDEATLGTRASLSHVTARQEVMGLVDALRLPIDDRGRDRAAARAEWYATAATPLETDDLIACGSRSAGRVATFKPATRARG